MNPGRGRELDERAGNGVGRGEGPKMYYTKIIRKSISCYTLLRLSLIICDMLSDAKFQYVYIVPRKTIHAGP